ncbi:MAG: TIGR04283 family arsenosugar biosynthesis glycosyltransferase [Chthoniobacterales bacterium]
MKRDLAADGPDLGRTNPRALRLRISVVIPTWRDTENLAALLPRLSAIAGLHQIIVVNASRDSKSEKIAADWGAIFLRLSRPNRGAQMNAGALAATGDVILFQHADTEITGAHFQAIEIALRKPEIIGGAFYRKFDGRHPRLMWLESVARFLSRHGGTLFGDQSVFVRREIFQELGGFAKIPLMEDVEFSRRLRRAGKVALLDPPVQTSDRHHARKGAWRTTVRNALFIVLYNFGISPFRLHRWYYPSAEIPTRARGAARAASAASLN